MATIDIREEAGVRSLHLGSEWVQGAMRIARPWNLELEYTRDMMVGLLLREDVRFPRQALLIGLGAASLTKFLYRHYLLARLTVVEIEPRVVAAARQYFKLPEDPRRLNIVIGDGAEFVMRENKSYDLILVDGFDGKARSGALNALPFYQNCRARLSSKGLAVFNLLSNSRSYKPSLERINTAFEGRMLILPSGDSGNSIVFAAAGEPIQLALPDIKEAALTLKENTGLNLLPAVARLQAAPGISGGNLTL